MISTIEIYCIAKDRTNLFIGSSQGLFISTDGGKSWEACNSGLPRTTRVEALVVSGENIFAGTNWDGLFRSEDSGKNRAAVDLGLSEPRILALLPVGKDLVVGTNGAGVWRLPLSSIADKKQKGMGN